MFMPLTYITNHKQQPYSKHFNFQGYSIFIHKVLQRKYTHTRLCLRIHNPKWRKLINSTIAQNKWLGFYSVYLFSHRHKHIPCLWAGVQLAVTPTGSIWHSKNLSYCKFCDTFLKDQSRARESTTLVPSFYLSLSNHFISIRDAEAISTFQVIHSCHCQIFGSGLYFRQV